MNGVRNSLMLLAASVMVAGAEPAVPAAVPTADKSVSFSHEKLTYSNSSVRLPLAKTAEPRLTFGSNLEFDGLIVDCLMPKKTWDMLDPSVPALNPPKPLPPTLLPVTAPRPLSNPAVHEANFALLRLSFP